MVPPRFTVTDTLFPYTTLVRSPEDRHLRSALARRDLLHILGEQRAWDQLVAVGHRFARRLGGAERGVIGGDAQLVGLGVEQSQRRRIGDRGADVGVGARFGY